MEADQAERKSAGRVASISADEPCPDCGHPGEHHGTQATVGCQVGCGTEDDPLCGCRRTRWPKVEVEIEGLCKVRDGKVPPDCRDSMAAAEVGIIKPPYFRSVVKSVRSVLIDACAVIGEPAHERYPRVWSLIKRAMADIAKPADIPTPPRYDPNAKGVRLALESAARSLESICDRKRVPDGDVRIFAGVRATVARNALSGIFREHEIPADPQPPGTYNPEEIPWAVFMGGTGAEPSMTVTVTADREPVRMEIIGVVQATLDWLNRAPSGSGLLIGGRKENTAEPPAGGPSPGVSRQLASDIARSLNELTDLVAVAADGPRLAMMEHVDAIAAIAHGRRSTKVIKPPKAPLVTAAKTIRDALGVSRLRIMHANANLPDPAGLFQVALDKIADAVSTLKNPPKCNGCERTMETCWVCPTAAWKISKEPGPNTLVRVAEHCAETAVPIAETRPECQDVNDKTTPHVWADDRRYKAGHADGYDLAHDELKAVPTAADHPLSIWPCPGCGAKNQHPDTVCKQCGGKVTFQELSDQDGGVDRRLAREILCFEPPAPDRYCDPITKPNALHDAIHAILSSVKGEWKNDGRHRGVPIAALLELQTQYVRSTNSKLPPNWTCTNCDDEVAAGEPCPDCGATAPGPVITAGEAREIVTNVRADIDADDLQKLVDLPNRYVRPIGRYSATIDPRELRTFECDRHLFRFVYVGPKEYPACMKCEDGYPPAARGVKIVSGAVTEDTGPKILDTEK